MKFSRIVNSTAVDTRTESPDGFFHLDVAAQFVEVPEQVEDGWTVADGVWSAPVIPEPVVPPAPVVVPPKVGPIEFQMLFTMAEQIAIEDSTDRVVRRCMKLVEDPRMAYVDLSLQSVGDALDYMTGIGLLTAGRKAEILTGVVV